MAFLLCDEGYLISKLHDISLFLYDINKWLALSDSPVMAKKMGVEYCKSRMYLEKKEQALKDVEDIKEKEAIQKEIEEQKRIEQQRKEKEEQEKIEKEFKKKEEEEIKKREKELNNELKSVMGKTKKG